MKKPKMSKTDKAWMQALKEMGFQPVMDGKEYVVNTDLEDGERICLEYLSFTHHLFPHEEIDGTDLMPEKIVENLLETGKGRQHEIAIKAWTDTGLMPALVEAIGKRDG